MFVVQTHIWTVVGVIDMITYRKWLLLMILIAVNEGSHVRSAVHGDETGSVEYCSVLGRGTDGVFDAA